MVLPIRLRAFYIPLAAVFIAGCIGTDYIEDPVDSGEPAITISTPGDALRLGESLQLTATYLDAFGVVRMPQISWSSSNSAVASVDAGGLVSGISAGQTMITASAHDYSSEPLLLTVVEDEGGVASVVVSPSTAELVVGESVTFSAAATNIDGEPVEPSMLLWSSSEPTIVSIDQNGTASAIGSGTASIRAEADGIRSKDVQVTVSEASGGMRSGMFQANPGTSYDVSGTAVLEERSGTLSVRFADDFTCSSGPRLHVYLTTAATVGTGSLDLGELISTSGAQTYEVPESVSLGDYDYVFIHCVPFNVSFGYATLTK